MKLSERTRTMDWWFWAVSLALLAMGLLGLRPGLLLFVLFSAIHTVVFIHRDGVSSVSAQVRLIYFVIAAVGLADPVAHFRANAFAAPLTFPAKR